MIRAVALTLALAACASGADLHDPQLTGPWVLHAVEPEPEPCGMAFDPDPELLAATQSAADRWANATGCDVRVEAGGLPVIVVADLRTTTGKIAAGACRHREGEPCSRIDIHATLGGANTVAHEMGHALAGVEGHSESGLMAEGASDGIDEASLELVCATFACSVMTPEH